MWSEHCSYKSSKVYLREFPSDGPRVVGGPGENAGVVDVGDGWVAVFKMESHNHPSFIEPRLSISTLRAGKLGQLYRLRRLWPPSFCVREGRAPLQFLVEGE